MAERVRRAGAPWRILVHEWLGRKGEAETGFPYGTAYHVSGDRSFGRPTTGGEPDSEQSKTIEIPGTEFDELVVGRWIHIEQMNSAQYWMNIGGVTLWVTADRDGRPTRVDVYGPRDYAEPVEGCVYEVTWTEPEGQEKARTSCGAQATFQGLDGFLHLHECVAPPHVVGNHDWRPSEQENT